MKLLRSVRGLIIGKSDSVKTTLLNNLLLQSGRLDYDCVYVCGESLYQPIYQFLQKSFGKGYSKEDIRNLLSVKGKCPLNLIDVVDGLPSPKQRSCIDAFFFHQEEDVPDPPELDTHRKNLMMFDGLMLSKQNKCNDYYV